jgi:hypothetical protein
MNLHRLQTSPPEWLGIALEEFEREFSYPLGDGVSFHVVHGRQYVAFFQAMGEAMVFVAERDGRVLGTVAVILRRLLSPKGKKTPVYYVCDLKVTRSRASGPVLARLMHAVRDHVLRTGVAPVYGIVMDGTARLPTQYTGRVDIPRFEPMAQLAVLRIPTEVNDAWAEACESVSHDNVENLREYLNLGAWSSPTCASELRSEMTALPLMSQYADGCGVLEDTRLGKRLMMHDGTEMRAAHLSWLGCGKPIAAMAVIQSARAIARQQGFPSLFVSLPHTEVFAGLIRSLVRKHGALLAPATVYGTGFPPSTNTDWWVNTSEI